MIVFPYYFGLGEFAFPSDRVIANAEDAAFEARMAELREPAPLPCVECGVPVALDTNDGIVIALDGGEFLDGAYDDKEATCGACVRLRCAACGTPFGTGCAHRSFGDAG